MAVAEPASEARDQVTIGPILGHDDRLAAAALFAAIWGVPVTESPLPADLLAALSHAGGCVLGAWVPDLGLIGATVGIAGAPGSDSLYSLIAGVAPGAAARGLGRRLKLAQRDWALTRGARTIVWTYDPLIRRNAHFNLNRLGARITGFATDFYPPMTDAVNRGDLTDRFVVEWRLTDSDPPVLPVGSADSPVVLATGSDGGPQPGGPVQGPSRVWIPSDIEALRRADPELGLRWRKASRAVFTELFAAGQRPLGLDSGGHYIFGSEDS